MAPSLEGLAPHLLGPAVAPTADDGPPAPTAAAVRILGADAKPSMPERMRHETASAPPPAASRAHSGQRAPEGLDWRRRAVEPPLGKAGAGGEELRARLLRREAASPSLLLQQGEQRALEAKPTVRGRPRALL